MTRPKDRVDDPVRLSTPQMMNNDPTQKIDPDVIAEHVADESFADAISASLEGLHHLHVIDVKRGFVFAHYRNASTDEDVRIFVRDAGVIARDLPGEGLTKFRLTDLSPVPGAFLEDYAAGLRWVDIKREYFRPHAWEVIAWDFDPKQIESVAAGALILREIGKATCRACGAAKLVDNMDERGRCAECQEHDLDVDLLRQWAANNAKARGLGRGSPCPCGSGEKLKACCGQ